MSNSFVKVYATICFVWMQTSEGRTKDEGIQLKRKC